MKNTLQSERKRASQHFVSADWTRRGLGRKEPMAADFRGEGSRAPLNDRSNAETQSRTGHDFAKISVYPRAPACGNSAGAHSHGAFYRAKSSPRLNTYPLGDTFAPAASKISSSGSPTVTVSYVPEAKDKSTKIVFIQVVRVLLDGKAVKPGTASSIFSHLDADTTADFYVVDHLSGEADPYYNGDDAQDIGTQGNATSTPKVTATMTDTVNYSDASFPTGKSTFRAEFRTLAFSAAGSDKGTYYSYAKWAYEKKKGAAATIDHQGTSTNTALPKTKQAISTWAKNHSFVMPK